MRFPKITIVTVSLNSEKYIEECIRSVTEQNYPALEYIIVDGGSTDGTLDIIKNYRDNISLCISEPDNGPADAINKGFLKASGEILGWLNSDDKLHPNALFAIAEIFQSFNNIDWIMGFPTWFKSDGACVNESYYQPEKFYYSTKFISDNLHLKFARWSKWRFAMGDFNAIQQESVFWRQSLWEKSGSYVKADTIAHDLELWTRFFKHADLYTANIVLAGFRVHGNQISVNNRLKYRKESEEYIETFKKELLKDNLGSSIRIQLAKMMKVFYYYDVPILRNIYPSLLELPSYITYDIAGEQFVINM